MIYRYEITTSIGEAAGTIEAANKDEAEQQLRDQHEQTYRDADKHEQTVTVKSVTLTPVK